MLRGKSVHIGVNECTEGYRRPLRALRAAERDAQAMYLLALQEGLDAVALIGEAATREAVDAAICGAAKELRSGDLFVLTFAGHGGTLPDVMGETDRPVGGENRWVDEPGDGDDEAWCLRDGVLLDDHLHELLALFASGVRVYVVSDSCFSGTMLRRAAESAQPPTIAASVLLLAACDEDQTTPESSSQGAFTQALLDAWNDGLFDGSHRDLYVAMKRRRDRTAEFRVGPRDEAFEAGRPFTIAPVARFVPPLKVHLCWFTSPAADPRCQAVARHIFGFLHRPLSEDGSADDPVQRPGLGIPVEQGRDLEDLLDALDRPRYDRAAEPTVEARLVVAILDRRAYGTRHNREVFARAVRRWTDPAVTKQNERLLPIVLDGPWTGELGDLTSMLAGMVVDAKESGRRWQVPADVGIVAGRLLLQKLGDPNPPRPRVFISHTKADGLRRAKGIVSHMREHSRVTVWYDEHDVDRGDQLVAQLEKAVEDGVVLVVRTDRYSDSPWCGLELLRAKERQTPMITLLDGADGEPAPSAYGGNHPTIVWREGREDEVVARCVQAWLHRHHFIAHARVALAHAGLPASAEILARRPELLDVTRRGVLATERRLLVYPDPPMTETESALLRAARPDLRMVTPSTMLGRASMAADPTPPLTGRMLAFSLSTVEDLPTPVADSRRDGLTSVHLDDVLYTVVLSTLHAGVQIAYGGDFRSRTLRGYAVQLSDMHRARRRLGTGERSQLLAFMRHEMRDGDGDVEYWPVPVGDLPAVDVDGEVATVLWTMNMRETMARRSDGRIVLGGQVRPMIAGDGGYRGPWSGVLEECWRTLAADRALYVIGAYGGFAGALAHMLTTGEVPAEFRRASVAGTRVEDLGARVDAARRALRGISSNEVLLANEDGSLLGSDEMAAGLLDRWQRFCRGEGAAWPNGLSVRDNRRLMRSTDPMEISHLVFAGLRKLCPEAPQEIDLALYHGDIASAVDVDGYAVTTTPGLQHIGALGALDRQMSGRLGREAARHGDATVVPVAVATEGLAGRCALVARLPLPAAGGALRSQVVEVLGVELARVATEQQLTSLAIAPFGTTMGLDIRTSIEALLRGLRRNGPTQLRTVVVCEVDEVRYRALRQTFAGISNVRELREGPVRGAIDNGIVVYANASEEPTGVAMQTTIYAVDGREAVVPMDHGKLSLDEWRQLHARPNARSTTAKVNEMLRTLMGPAIFDRLAMAAGRRIVLVTNELASSVPWEFVAPDGDTIPALGAGITRRVAMAGLARPPADHASTDGLLRILLIVNPTGDLPDAEAEGDAVRAAVRERADVEVECLRGASATVDAVSAKLATGAFDVLHYAGHARFVEQDRGASGLVLADGQLFAGAVFRDEQVRAPRLVVLGGCESARLRDDPAAAPPRVPGAQQPFAEALLRAGVATLVGTFYPVTDRASRQFATTLYLALAAGRPVGEAVVAARGELHEAKLVDWGNFLLYGDDGLIL